MADLAATVLERAILAVQKRDLDFRTMAWTFAASDLQVPSLVPPSGQGFDTIEPLLVRSGELQLLALFTTPVRAADFAPSYRYLTVQLGFDIIRRLPPEVGIVVNPGSPIGFEMRADGVAQLRDEVAGA